jgi:prophage regulatory protein
MRNTNLQNHKAQPNAAVLDSAARGGIGCNGLIAGMAPAAYEHHHPIRILRLPEVMARVGICRASIYQQMGGGLFPKSIPLGPRAVGWIESEIDAWLAARIRKRGAPLPED